MYYIMLLLVPKDILCHITEWLELWEIGMIHRICKRMNKLGSEMYRNVKQITIDRFSIVEHLRVKCPGVRHIHINDITLSHDEMKVLHDFPVEMLKYTPYKSEMPSYTLSFPRLRNLHIQKLANFNLDACNMLTTLTIKHCNAVLDITKFPMLKSVTTMDTRRVNFEHDTPFTADEHIERLFVDITRDTKTQYLQSLKKIKIKELSILSPQFHDIVNELPYTTYLSMLLSNHARIKPLTSTTLTKLYLCNAHVSLRYLRDLVNLNSLIMHDCVYNTDEFKLISRLPVSELTLRSCVVTSEMLAQFRLKKLKLIECNIPHLSDLPTSITDLTFAHIDDLVNLRDLRHLNLNTLEIFNALLSESDLSTISTLNVKCLILKMCNINNYTTYHLTFMKLDSLRIYDHELTADGEHMLRSSPNIRKVFISQKTVYDLSI